MEWYWRLQDMPELQDLDAPTRRAQWSKALAAGRTRTRALVLAVLFGIVFATRRWVAGRFHLNWVESAGAVILVFGLVSFVFEAIYQQPRTRKWLREHLPAGGDG